ncbi:hypothetical protein IQ244_27545 [Nostoc sp. LEGE 06077]|uniref:hypothetical protein n=1 Tax=Nostoc sp. LEGE 06077 TaxID=915325 RepID=UPI00187E964B|nr:hypothetical protein [Nostoc sp. LEGE 06077]MBE9210183.1 hypothetical protein [Nostoc sp. LEGE 06077]
MTSRADEIQKLIADIDNLLTNNGKRLPKLLSGQAPEAREVLERVRNFLVNLKETEDLQGNIPQPTGQMQPSPLLAKFAEQVNQPSSVESYQSEPAENSVLGSQFKSELAILIQPLQAELTALLQERSTLMQEIRQLEQKRLQNYSLSQQLANQEQIIGEFLQVLMSRLVPTVAPHINANVANDFHAVSSSHHNNIELTASGKVSALESSGQVERLSQFAKELDQRLLSLDGTVNVVFEALQRNINTYHESLAQALARMHSTGLQGEQLLVSFLNNWTQQLQQLPTTIPQAVVKETSARSPFPSQPNAVTVETAPPQAITTPETIDPALELPQPEVEFASDMAANDLDAMLLELTGIVTQAADNSPASLELEGFEDWDKLADDPQPLLNLQPLIPTSSREQGTGDREQVTGNREQVTGDREQVIGNREQVTGDREQPTPEVVTPPPEAFGIFNDSTPQSLELTDTDEVDQLYASLFNISAVTQLSVEPTPEKATPDFSANSADTTPPSTPVEEPKTSPGVTEDLAELNHSENPALTPLFEGNVGLPESIFTHSDAGLFEPIHSQPPNIPTDSQQFIDLSSDFQQKLFFEEEPELSSATLSYSPALRESNPVQPEQTDTITSLSELFAEASSEEHLWPGLSPAEIAMTLDEPEPTPEVAVTDEVQENLSDNLSDIYIAASPQENLLASEVMQSANLPEISLNESQLQQLNQDLANFDELLNYQSGDVYSLADSQPPDVAFPHPQTLDHTPNVAFSRPAVPPVAPISLPQTQADLNFSPVNEKKKEVTTGSSFPNQIEMTVDVHNSVWYLGIDLGTTGISAALLNRSQSVVYPIYWSAENIPGSTSFQHSFRLPAEVYLPNASVSNGGTQAKKSSHCSAQLKPYLQVAIPYQSEPQKWEPVLQFNEFSAGPLIWVVRSLSKLLLTLKSDRQSTTQGLVATAVGINQPTFHTIVSQIAGVICNCPSSWSEQYRFNVREALLTSKIIQHPQQVFFVEEAIASLISLFDKSDSEVIQVSDRQGLQPVQTAEPLLGNTLVINIGATATEMALVDVPENLLQLAHQDFMLHSFPYASKGIEQDIICQLLIPPKYRQSRKDIPDNAQNNTSSPWHWQPAFPDIDKMQWQSLGLDKFDLPRAGEPDIGVRIRLHQRLESSVLGQAALESALALKLILQHQENFTLDLADQRWELQRRDLESQVFVPFVRRLNRELNKLLVARGIPTEAINQAILTGGVASLGVVYHWLKQKLPNAKIMQDAYLGENGAPNCSRVALGLAMLPLHPQILEEPRQQYTDYFLFTELLRLLPERSLSFNEVLQLFEGRGINTSICQQRLLAFLEGELPAGLIPSPPESAWLTLNSSQNLDYQAIASAPLFEKQGNLSYRPNSQQLSALRRYLAAVKTSTQQSLEEPYTVNFVNVPL